MSAATVLFVLVSSRALFKKNDFTVSHVMFCEKLWISFRIDSCCGARVERLHRLDSLPFIENGNKQPLLQRCSAALARQDGNVLPSLRHVLNMDRSSGESPILEVTASDS